jgi:hypothetical protein
MQREIPRWKLAALGAVALLTVTTAACGSSSDGTKVASIDDKGSESAEDGGGGQGGSGEQVDFEDAMLEYAQCMRDNGVDMPDPTFSEDGKGAIAIQGRTAGAGAGAGPDPSSADFEEAAEVCDPIMEDARSNMPQPSPEEKAEMQDEMLAFTACMREHGVDMPDPTFTDDGGVALTAPGKGPAPDAPAGGDPEASEGPRTDPAFEAALEECQGDGQGGFAMATPAMGSDQ